MEEASKLEVIAAYSAPRTVIPAVSGNVDLVFGWYVVGAFWLPRSCVARLDVISEVTNVALISRARLYDMSALGEVGGSRVSNRSAIPFRSLSGEVPLIGGVIYQIQVDCILPSDGGSAADTDFCVVSTATISD